MTNYRKNNNTRKQSGVTLIELVLVVSLIAIVAAVSVGVINIGRQEEIAQGASKKSNMIDYISIHLYDHQPN